MENKTRSISKASVDNQEPTSPNFQQRQTLSQQTQQQQSQTQQQQKSHNISHTQTLNEQQQQHLQNTNAHNTQQSTITTPQTNAPLMHSQTSTYTQHQPYNIYSQHQNPRSTQLYSSRATDIGSTSFHQPPSAAAQFPDYPTYGSHQQQSARYHPSNSSHSDLSSSSNHAHSLPTHPPASLSDFYGAYYPQWSSFMLASPSQNPESPHLMHNAATTYPPIAPPTHSHSHHAKVPPNTHQQWQQHYHP